MADPRITETPTLAELKSQFARDYRLAAIDAGVVDDISIAPGSDADLLGTAVSHIALVGITKTQIAAEAINVFTAVEDDLDDIRAQDGLPVVSAAGATGRIVPKIEGATTIVDGAQFIYPNGSRGAVVGNYIGPSDGTEINVAASNTGEKTNLAGGEKVRFVQAPVNVQSEATVSNNDPLTGGTDVEDDERKRQRINNNRRNRPAGGNWGQMRQDILDGAPGIQDVYIYPALGGPASAKIIPVRDFDLDLRDFSRAPSSALLNQVRGIIWGKNSSNDNLVVQAPVDESADVALQITIPHSALSGGNGQGWTDATPWPPLVVADSGRVTVVSYAALTLRVSANTTTSPVAGQTTVAWWSRSDMAFYTAAVTSVAQAGGDWVLSLDRDLLDADGIVPSAGDYISPAAKNLSGYGKEWVELFRALGPGEQTEDVGRLPRAKRHPFVTDEDPADINTVTINRLSNAYPEITSMAFAYSPTTTPTVPTDVDDASQVLIPGNFGIYKA